MFHFQNILLSSVFDLKKTMQLKKKMNDLKSKCALRKKKEQKKYTLSRACLYQIFAACTFRSKIKPRKNAKVYLKLIRQEYRQTCHFDLTQNLNECDIKI